MPERCLRKGCHNPRHENGLCYHHAPRGHRPPRFPPETQATRQAADRAINEALCEAADRNYEAINRALARHIDCYRYQSIVAISGLLLDAEFKRACMALWGLT